MRSASASIRRGRLFPENRVKGPGSQVNGEKLRTIALRVGIRRVSGALCAGTNPHECDDFGRLYGETGKNQTRCWSGRTMARTGLRMMPTFPSSPLRFRTAGFPQYGSKAGLSDGACPCGAAIASLGLRPSFVSSAA